MSISRLHEINAITHRTKALGAAASAELIIDPRLAKIMVELQTLLLMEYKRGKTLGATRTLQAVRKARSKRSSNNTIALLKNYRQ